MQVVSVGVHDILPKLIDCNGNVPQQIGKQGTDLSSALKALSYGEKHIKRLIYKRKVQVFCDSRSGGHSHLERDYLFSKVYMK